MSSGLKLPSGLDMDDVFKTTGSGSQTFNILTSDGIDIGNKYEAGSTNIPDTGFRTTTGVDVRHKLGGSGVGIFRPSCLPWNGHITGGHNAYGGHFDWWVDWVKSWINNKAGTVAVNGILDDSIYRGVNSGTTVSSVIFAYSPFKTGQFSFSCTKVHQEIWHNNWCDLQVHNFSIDGYCKGVVLIPVAGAGGGVRAVLRTTLTVDGFGTMTYESMHGFAYDSNMENPGTQAWSATVNGKYYYYH